MASEPNSNKPSTLGPTTPKSWIRRTQIVEMYTWLDTKKLFPTILMGILALGVGVLLTPDFVVRSYPNDANLVGTPSIENIKAPFDLDILDSDATQFVREEAIENTRRIYDLDAQLPERLRSRINHAFASMRTYMNKSLPMTVEIRQEFVRELKSNVTADAFQTLVDLNFSDAIQKAISHLVITAASEPICGSMADLSVDANRGIIVQKVTGADNKMDRVLYNDISAIADLAAIRRQIEALAPNVMAEYAPHTNATQQHEMAKLAANILEANLTLNRAATERQRAEAGAAIKPVMVTIKKGEMVIRDGERITKRQMMVLQALHDSSHRQSMLLVGIGGVFIMLILVTMAGRLANSYYHTHDMVLKARDLVFLAVLFLGNLALTKAWMLVCRALQDSYPNIPREAFLACLPVAFGAIMVRLVLRTEVAVLFSIIMSFMVGLMADNDRMLAIYALVGSVAATATIRSISARSDLLRAGVMAGITQTACMIAIQLFGATASIVSYLWPLPATMLSGIAAGILALALTPAIEWAFNYTTELKLLELANLNHPALKELIVQAPGSYHHSIIVGALVEAAADSVGANSLLARVMAYYHDLGKGCNPGYFVENQKAGQNPHDKLKPSMSAMIIRRHVTDGILLAQQYGLGEQILAGIAQHHGNTLIQYFYHRAKEQAAELGETVPEADYRYPGEKPQTREAALVMLGDSIEAASRSIAEPSAARLQGLVHKIINQKFTDGQLEECDLTLRDLHTIAKSFSRVLTSIYHHRMEYPDAKDNTKKKGPGDSGSGKDDTAPYEQTNTDSIHRLGMS